MLSASLPLSRLCIIPWGAALLSFASMIWLYFPGLMTADAAFQYLQVKTGEVSDLHPPLMVFIWQIYDALGLHYGWFWATPALLFWLALGWLATQLLERIGSQLAFIFLLGYSPVFIYNYSALWKDSWLLALMLLSLACLLRLHRHYHILFLFGAMACLLLALMLRHNALLAILPLLYCAIHAAKPSWPAGRQWLAAVFLLCAMMFFAQTMQRLSSAHVSMWPTIGLWDLAAVSIRENTMLLPQAALGNETVTLEDIRRDFSPDFNTSLCRYDSAREMRLVRCMEQLPLVKGPLLDPADTADLQQHWLRMIMTYPQSYLAHRWEVFCRLLGACESGNSAIPSRSFPQKAYGKWVDGADPTMLGIKLEEVRNPIGLLISRGLMELRQHTYLLSGWLYMLLLWMHLLYALTSPPTTTRRLALAINASGWLMLLPLFFIAPNMQLRYLVGPIMASLIGPIISLSAKTGLRVRSDQTIKLPKE